MLNRKLVEDAVNAFGAINNIHREDASHFNGSSERQLDRVNRIGMGGEYTQDEIAALSRYTQLSDRYYQLTRE